MRQACSHPWLITKEQSLDRDAVDIRPATKNDEVENNAEVDELTAALEGLEVRQKECKMCREKIEVGVNGQKGDVICTSCTKAKAKFSGLMQSTKVMETMKILERIRGEDKRRKTIVFSQVSFVKSSILSNVYGGVSLLFADAIFLR